MTDDKLVERLRYAARPHQSSPLERDTLLAQAADRIEALTAEVTERDRRIQFYVDAETAATKRADELADQATSQADRIEALEKAGREALGAIDRREYADAATTLDLALGVGR